MSCTYASALIRSLSILLYYIINQGEGCHVRRLASVSHVDSQTLNAITCVRKEGDEREKR